MVIMLLRSLNIAALAFVWFLSLVLVAGCRQRAPFAAEPSTPATQPEPKPGHDAGGRWFGPYFVRWKALDKAEELQKAGFRTEVVGGLGRWHVRAWR